MVNVIRTEVQTMIAPLRWPVLTWFGLLLWLGFALFMNYPPPVVITSYTSAGPVENSERFATFENYPDPIGWPFRYLKPDPVVLWAPPTGLQADPDTSNFCVQTALLNIFLVSVVLASLALTLLTCLPRFTVRSLLLLPVMIGSFLLCSRLIERGIGPDANWYFGTAIYFSPILYAFLHLCGARLVHSSCPVSSETSADGG